jgi:hypothetical protein
MRRALLLVAVAAALLCAGAARADGDPASDYLYTQKVFVPFDVKPKAATQRDLRAVVQGANEQGYKIRVAVIGSRYDLGAVPSLWKQPQTYARFLGAELRFLYKQRLLVVMPNGFGFNWPGHKADAAKASAALKAITVAPGPDGLVQAAHDAVLAVAKREGVQVKPAGEPKSTTNRDRVIVIAAAVVLIALACAGRYVLRRRRRA